MPQILARLLPLLGKLRPVVKFVGEGLLWALGFKVGESLFKDNSVLTDDEKSLAAVYSNTLIPTFAYIKPSRLARAVERGSLARDYEAGLHATDVICENVLTNLQRNPSSNGSRKLLSEAVATSLFIRQFCKEGMNLNSICGDAKQAFYDALGSLEDSDEVRDMRKFASELQKTETKYLSQDDKIEFALRVNAAAILILI